MKNIINTTTILFATMLITCVTISSCNKKAPTAEANGLPFATQTGANTFGCLVGTEPTYTHGWFSSWAGNGVEYHLSADSTLEIFAITKSGKRKDFNLVCKLKNGIIGTHNCNKHIGAGYSDLNIDGGTAPFGGNYFECIDSLPATITISKFTGDVTKGSQTGAILSGTFDITMQNGGETKLHISSGRFDLIKP
jgi:hypothetical protein